MKKIDRELKALSLFYEHMDKNIFYTRHAYKLENEIKISKKFPIYLKNPNEFEIEYIMENNFKQIYSFVSIFPTLKTLIEMNDFFIDDIYYAFKEEIYDIKRLYKEYLKHNDEGAIKLAINNNDKKSFSLYLSSLFNEDVILIEIKKWDEIDKYLSKYFNCGIDDVEDLDYRINFIERYINFLNIMNFDLRVFQGISLLEDKCKLAFTSYYSTDEYDKIFETAMSNMFIIDSFVQNGDDIMTLFFIINNFEKSRYMRERKYIVDIVTCLESLLVKKIIDVNSKIETQFIRKVKKCCQFFDYNLPTNELKELYNYRSLVVHGNFADINRKTNEITSKKWYKEYSRIMDEKYGELSYDNNVKEDLIFSRLFEIFRIVFKLYCEKNDKLKSLKEITLIEEINNFEF